MVFVDRRNFGAYFPASGNWYVASKKKDDKMKVRSSLKSAKTRDKNCRIVRRRGRLYVINKQNPRFKARQG